MANYTEVAITTLGQALITKAQAGATIDLTRMQIGSGQLGGGNPAGRTALISPIAYFNINSITKNENTASVLGIFENSALSSSTYTCEIGLFAQDPDLGEILYAYANAEAQGDTFPPISSGPYSLQFKLNVAIGIATTVTATIPPGVYIPQSQASVDPDLNSIVQRTSGGQVKAAAPAEADDAARLTEIQAPPFVTTSGTGTTYAATFSPAFSALVPGTRITIKMNLANTGAATINVNGLGAKTILKSNGSGLTAGNLKLNSVYTLVYDGTSFILQGEGGEYGTAGAAQVLTGYNIGTESGLVAGTMPNNGALNFTPGQSAQSIPAGYTSGGNVAAVSFDETKVLTGMTISGKAGTMPNRAGDTAALASSVSGTTLKLRASNGYRDGVDDNVTITDADFIAANIKTGVNLFGLIGTMPLNKRTASGTATSTEGGTWLTPAGAPDTDPNAETLTIQGHGFVVGLALVWKTNSFSMSIVAPGKQLDSNGTSYSDMIVLLASEHAFDENMNLNYWRTDGGTFTNDGTTFRCVVPYVNTYNYILYEA